MSFVLVAGAIIGCSHGGQVKLSAGDSRLIVDDNGAITLGMEAGLTFGSPNSPTPGMAPCTGQVLPVPPTGPAFTPCITNPAAQGMATKLAVGNLPALLDTAAGTTVTPQPPGQWSVVSAGQAKLEAV